MVYKSIKYFMANNITNIIFSYFKFYQEIKEICYFLKKYIIFIFLT